MSNRFHVMLMLLVHDLYFETHYLDYFGLSLIKALILLAIVSVLYKVVLLYLSTLL